MRRTTRPPGRYVAPFSSETSAPAGALRSFQSASRSQRVKPPKNFLMSALASALTVRHTHRHTVLEQLIQILIDMSTNDPLGGIRENIGEKCFCMDPFSIFIFKIPQHSLIKDMNDVFRDREAQPAGFHSTLGGAYLGPSLGSSPQSEGETGGVQMT